MKFRPGDKVFHTSKGKLAKVVEANWGLGYKIAHSGFIWSVPEWAIEPREPLSATTLHTLEKQSPINDSRKIAPG